MIKRLFIKFPLYVVFFTLMITCVAPLGYWVITGNDPTDFLDEIEKV